MPNATRRSCDYPGCDAGPPDANNIHRPYVTHPDNVRREEVTEDLKQLVEMAHLLPIRLEEAASCKIEAEANKILAEAQRLTTSLDPPAQIPSEARRYKDKRDSIPRSKIEENITESDWGFFSAQWKRYTSSTSMEPDQEVNHLWAACSEQLQRSLHNVGAGELRDPKALMSTIKLLSVKRRNNLVNIVELQRTGRASLPTAPG